MYRGNAFFQLLEIDDDRVTDAMTGILAHCQELKQSEATFAEFVPGYVQFLPTYSRKPLFVAWAWFMDQYASVLQRTRSDGLKSAPYFSFLSPNDHHILQRCNDVMSWNSFSYLESNLKSKVRKVREDEHRNNIRKFVQVKISSVNTYDVFVVCLSFWASLWVASGHG